MAGGFTVRAGALRSGSGQVAGFQQECEGLGGRVSGVLAGLAGAAGGGSLAGALERMTETGIKRFLDATAVYQHISQGLSQTADGYSNAEADIASRVAAIHPGRLP